MCNSPTLGRRAVGARNTEWPECPVLGLFFILLPWGKTVLRAEGCLPPGEPPKALKSSLLVTPLTWL